MASCSTVTTPVIPWTPIHQIQIETTDVGAVAGFFNKTLGLPICFPVDSTRFEVCGDEAGQWKAAKSWANNCMIMIVRPEGCDIEKPTFTRIGLKTREDQIEISGKSVRLEPQIVHKTTKGVLATYRPSMEFNLADGSKVMSVYVYGRNDEEMEKATVVCGPDFQRWSRPPELSNGGVLGITRLKEICIKTSPEGIQRVHDIAASFFPNITIDKHWFHKIGPALKPMIKELDHNAMEEGRSLTSRTFIELLFAVHDLQKALFHLEESIVPISELIVSDLGKVTRVNLDTAEFNFGVSLVEEPVLLM